MPVTLASLTFDTARTTADEQLEEVGGRDARIITLRGLIFGLDSLEAVEARLDAIAEAASKEDYSAELSLRADRRYLVRRTRYKRDVSRTARVGTFELVLESRDPFEESVNESTVPWPIGASGATIALTTAGNAETLPQIALRAVGNVINPSFSDGTHRITYKGTVGDAETLLLDGANRRAWLNDKDVTPYTEGAFPGIKPEGTTLVYADDAASSHTADVTIAYRDRWW